MSQEICKAIHKNLKSFLHVEATNSQGVWRIQPTYNGFASYDQYQSHWDEAVENIEIHTTSRASTAWYTSEEDIQSAFNSSLNDLNLKLIVIIAVTMATTLTTKVKVKQDYTSYASNVPKCNYT